jgi:hypothetical protein
MSNSLAIAAVTATLRNLLLRGIHADSELSDATVTTQPIDKARNNNNANQINLFLYLTSQDPAFRNTTVSRYVQPGELGYPPLALDLYYLVTAYGRDNDDVLGHRLLGKAMSILLDHPVLGADEIRNALAGNDLYEQVERIRISPQPMTVDEASKLWMVFQTQYRISVAYRADIVLIDSNRPVRSPLPVLAIGEEDKGPTVIAGLLPTFNGIAFSNRRLCAELNDAVIFQGTYLDSITKLQFSNNHLELPIEIDPEPGGTASEVIAKISKQPANDSSLWPAGFYAVRGIFSKEGLELTTNEVAMPLAPKISIKPRKVPRGRVTLKVSVMPNIFPEQNVILLFGDQQIPAGHQSSSTETITFTFDVANPGTYLVRLRVDGVDSVPLDLKATIPSFADSQKVIVT